MRGLVAFISCAALTVWGLGQLAPKPVHKTVRPSIIKPGVCGSFGTVVKAVEVDRIGPIYHVTCSSGVRFEVVQ